jgi:hypothetical protein
MVVGRTQGWRNRFRHRARLVFVATCAAVLLLSHANYVEAQAMPTATRLGDLQIGGGLAFGASTYNFNTADLIGESAYLALDIRNHWGAEVDFHNVKDTSDSTVYERTYEFGPRYHITRGSLVPYAKLMYGRGVYNFHDSVANLAYNVYTAGGGVDWQVLRSWNLRADYEYQTWPGFPVDTLHPQVITLGVAFHLHQ